MKKHVSMFVLYLFWALLVTRCRSSESPELKRKRLVDLVENYSELNLLETECTETKNTSCEVCNSGMLAAYCLSSPANDNKKVRACKSCLRKMKLPQVEERILMNSTENILEVGKIVNIQNGEYLVECLELKYVKKTIQFPIKLVHEIIPNEKLCQMCNSFTFGEQKCARKNCGQIICHSCFDQVSRCEYCRLLHIGTPVIIRQRKASNANKVVFKRRYGVNSYIWYGLIKGILFESTIQKRRRPNKLKILSEEKNGRVEYIVELSNEYLWMTNQNGKMEFNFKNKSIPAIMLENELEIFKSNYEELQ